MSPAGRASNQAGRIGAPAGSQRRRPTQATPPDTTVSPVSSPSAQASVRPTRPARIRRRSRRTAPDPARQPLAVGDAVLDRSRDLTSTAAIHPNVPGSSGEQHIPGVVLGQLPAADQPTEGSRRLQQRAVPGAGARRRHPLRLGLDDRCAGRHQRDDATAAAPAPARAAAPESARGPASRAVPRPGRDESSGSSARRGVIRRPRRSPRLLLLCRRVAFAVGASAIPVGSRRIGCRLGSAAGS